MNLAARPPGARRGAVVLAVGVLAGVSAAPAAAAVPTTQPLVTLTKAAAVRSAPRADARVFRSVAERRPLTRVRTVLPVVGARRGWVQVRLPGRPNGDKGWIRTASIRRSTTPWHVRVDLSARRVVAYRDGEVQRRFSAIIGAPATPTPVGRFFVEEAVRLAPAAAGGPFALATSARSEVLQEFEGGPGQVALHGTNHLSGAPGSASSHGCVRLSDAAIRWLAARIGRGVPVTVVR